MTPPRHGEDGRDALRIRDVGFTPASARDRARGMLGWIHCELSGLRLDGLSLRLTADGRRCLAFPKRRDGTGRWRSYIAPIDDAARLEIERQVFEALGLREAE